MNHIYKPLIFFTVVLYCSYAYLYFFNNGLTGFKPLYWQFITIGAGLSLIILRLPSGIPNLPRNYFIWLCVFLGNSIFCFLYSGQGEIEVQALTKSFEVVALLFSFLIIFSGDDAISTIRKALVMVVLFSVVMNFIDFLTPMWSKVPGRAAGLYENPTIAGKMLVLAMVASIPLIPQKIRLIFCAFVGLGVFITFSRGPWLLWGLAMAGLASTGYFIFSARIFSVTFVSLLSGFIIYSALTGGILDIMTAIGLDEYLTTGTYARLGGGTAFTDYSTATRAAVAAKAWSVFAENPWFGAGLAVDQGWVTGSHNTYLRMAAEGGIIRLAIFISLLVILWKMTDNIGRVLIIVYSVSCLTSHDNLQQPALLVIISLIVTLSNPENIAIKREPVVLRETAEES